jgi:hypothetical protein
MEMDIEIEIEIAQKKEVERNNRDSERDFRAK